MSLICDRCSRTYDEGDQQGSSSANSDQLCEYCATHNIGIIEQPMRKNSVDEFENDREFGVRCLFDLNHIAVVFCKDCGEYFCVICATIAHSSKLTFDHILVRIADSPANTQGLLPVDSNYEENVVGSNDFEENAESYEEIIGRAEKIEKEISKMERILHSIIIRLEGASVTYNTEDAIDFVEMEKQIDNHFNEDVEESKRKAMQELQAFKTRTIEEFEKGIQIYTNKYEELKKLKKENNRVLMLTRGDFLNNSNTCIDLGERLNSQKIEEPGFETKIFEMKFRQEHLEIIEKRVNWNLELVFGPYFDEYIIYSAQKYQNKLYSGNRFETSNGVMALWNEKEFKKYSKIAFIGKNWNELVENTNLIFTMPNKLANAEIEKIKILMKDNAKNDIKIGINAEIDDEIDEKLEEWLIANNKEYFRIPDKKLEKNLLIAPNCPAKEIKRTPCDEDAHHDAVLYCTICRAHFCEPCSRKSHASKVLETHYMIRF